MRVLLLLALAAGVAGCSPHSASPPVLQRFQALRGLLSATTDDSDRLAPDIIRLNQSMRATDLPAVRRNAVSLKGDAVRLEAHAGASAYGLHGIDRSTAPPAVRNYLGLVAAGLSQEWWEAQDAVRLANLVWHDPMLMDRRDETRLRRLDLAVRWHAWQSVLCARRAARLKSRSSGAFRYVPVKPHVAA